jgi:DNA-binding protein Fis
MARRRRKPTFKKRLSALVEDFVAKGIRLDEAHEQLEREYLVRVLERCEGNQCRAAETLQIHRNTLRRKLRKHGLL